MAVVCCRRCLLHSSGLSYMLILDSMRLWEVKNKVRPISDWRCTMKPLLTLHVLWVPPHIIQCESFYTSHAMWVPSHTMQCESFYTSHAMWVPSHTMQCESFRTPYSVSPFTHHAMRVLAVNDTSCNASPVFDTSCNALGVSDTSGKVRPIYQHIRIQYVRPVPIESFQYIWMAEC